MSPDSNTTPLYVPLDIGKNVHWFAAFCGPDLREVLPPTKVRSTRPGYEQVRHTLEDFLTAPRYAPIVVGLEPTGIYHEAWAYALHQDFGARLDLRFLNPYQTKDDRQQHQPAGRQRKSDPLDLYAIARCLRDGLGHPAYLPQGDDLDFEQWAATFRQAHRTQQRLGVRLLTQLDRLWPGALANVKAFRTLHPDLEPPVPLVLSKALERDLLQAILTHAPNPYDWLDRSLSDIQAFFREHVGRCGPQTAQRVHTVVHQALLPPPDLAARLADRLQADFSRYQQLAQQLADLRTQAEELVPRTTSAVLLTVPGLSAFLIARYRAYVGDVHRFQHADQIWALAGFDPQYAQSGDHRWVFHISHRGHPELRLILFQIGLHTSQQCPPIAQARQRALDHGKGRVGAILHAAHKANRVCFRLLLDQVPFDPQRCR